MIDVKNNKIHIAGYRKLIEFDKLLVAWGAEKNKL